MDICDWLPEFQVSAETDKDLQEYFLKTQEVHKITNTNRWLVLGRKGTGKTAIYEYLQASSPADINNYIVIPLNFSDYPWPAHKLYKDILAGEQTAYQKSWKYLFFIKAVSRLISIKKEKKEEIPAELKWAEKYISTIYGCPDPSLLELVISKINRVSKIKGPGVDLEDISLDAGNISLEEVSASKDLQNQLRSNAFTLLRYFEEIFKKNVGSRKILIIMDQLDENWLAGETEEYSKVLINLVNVCRNISVDKSLGNSLKVLPFLRSDIYHSLRFNDKNKLLQDSAIEINWNNETLDTMFFQRIAKYKPSTLNLETDKKSGCIFEVNFARQGTPPFKYVTRRSFFRPRDIIVYFNKIRACHIQNNSGLYTTSELYEADREASVSIYNEIVDEWSNQFPEIEELITVLQIIQTESFDYEEFKVKYFDSFSSSNEGEMRKRLQFLFDNSIVGQKKQGRWEYICSLPNLKMNIELKYRTHPSLKYRLHLVENRT